MHEQLLSNARAQAWKEVNFSEGCFHIFAVISPHRRSQCIGVCGFTADGRLPAYLRAEMQKEAKHEGNICLMLHAFPGLKDKRYRLHIANLLPQENKEAFNCGLV